MKLIARFIKVFTVAVCMALFFNLTYDVFEKFQKKLTTTAVQLYDSYEEAKTLPSLTICPWSAFKERGFHFTSEKYEKMVFSLEDLGNTSAESEPKMKSKDVYISEIRTATYGKCFTFDSTKPLGFNEPSELCFRRSWDLKVFIHNLGEEFWIPWTLYGPSNNMVRLNIKSDAESGMTRINVAEKIVKLYPKSVRPCNQTSSGNSREAILMDAAYHRECCRAKLWEKIRSRINCTIIGLDVFIKNSKEDELPECKILEDAAHTFDVYQEETGKYFGKTWLLGCPMPCLQLQYSYTLTDFHPNNWVQPINPSPQEFIEKFYFVLLAFGSMDVEKKEETLMYDSANFFAAAGGNLGLFLGFSCLSIIFAGVDLFMLKLGYK